MSGENGRTGTETEKSAVKQVGCPPGQFGWKPGQSGNPYGRPKGTSMAAKIRKAFDRYCQRKGKKDWADWLAWMAIDNGDQQCLQIAASKAIPNAPQDLNINHEFTPTDEQLARIREAREALARERDESNRIDAKPWPEALVNGRN